MERGKQENRLPQERPENIYQREKEKVYESHSRS